MRHTEEINLEKAACTSDAGTFEAASQLVLRSIYRFIYVFIEIQQYIAIQPSNNEDHCFVTKT